MIATSSFASRARFVLAIFCLAIIVQPSALHSAEFDHRALAETARTAFILPGYRNFAKTIDHLRNELNADCSNLKVVSFRRARVAFRSTIVAWGGIEIIQFGPVANANRLERIFYWPDRKGIGRRQVMRLLRAGDMSATSPAKLSKKSVAVQGLTAMEHILYERRSGSETPTSDAMTYRCTYLRAITQNLGNIVDQIVRSWVPGGAFARIWLRPGPNNPAYLSDEETTRELVKALDQSLESVRDRRIAPPLGFGRNRRQQTKPILWRSNLSMTLIAANIVSARDLLFRGGLANAYLESQDQGPIAIGIMSSLKSEFDLTIRAARALTNRNDVFARPDVRRNLMLVGFPLKNIRTQSVAAMKRAAGLSIGFNASDGD
ncbi:MAG: imelysin family protein [Hyphomicrobiaceae bacterium]